MLILDHVAVPVNGGWCRLHRDSSLGAAALLIPQRSCKLQVVIATLIVLVSARSSALVSCELNSFQRCLQPLTQLPLVTVRTAKDQLRESQSLERSPSSRCLLETAVHDGPTNHPNPHIIDTVPFDTSALEAWRVSLSPAKCESEYVVTAAGIWL